MSRPININDPRPFANTPRVTNPTALAAISRNEERRRSAFPSFDGTMGDARDYDPSGQLLRDVIVRIDGYYQSPYYGNANKEGIKATLDGQGWIVERITDETSSWFPQAAGGFNYRLFIVVGTNWSDGQILSNLKRDLSGFFNVSGAHIDSPPWVPTVAPPSSTPPPVYGNPTPGAQPPPNDPKDKSEWTKWLEELAADLKVPVTVLMAGGALLLVVLLTRDR